MLILLGFLGAGFLSAHGWQESNVYVAIVGVLMLYFTAYAQGSNVANCKCKKCE